MNGNADGKNILNNEVMRIFIIFAFISLLIPIIMHIYAKSIQDKDYKNGSCFNSSWENISVEN